MGDDSWRTPGTGYAVRCLAVPGKASGASPIGAWLSGYDPDGNGGHGLAEWTYNPAEAMIFATEEAATDCQNAIPRTRSALPDGTPNRPLAAFDLELVATPLPPLVAADPYTDGRPLRDRVQLYDDLPPGIGSLLDLATVLINRAFVSHRTGNLAVCDAFLNEGLHACGALFQIKVQAMMDEPKHIEDRAWTDFFVHLTAVVPAPKPAVAAPPARPAPPRPAPEMETEQQFRARLARMVADLEARKHGQQS